MHGYSRAIPVHDTPPAHGGKLFVCVRVFVNVCACVRMCLCMCVCVLARVHARVFVRVSVGVCVSQVLMQQVRSFAARVISEGHSAGAISEGGGRRFGRATAAEAAPHLGASGRQLTLALLLAREPHQDCL